MDTNLKIYCEGIEGEALRQIERLAAYEAYQREKIRIMPDAHAGMGCTIGTTMNISDKVTPNLVGVDIGCGMAVVELGHAEIDCNQLDQVIQENIPSGMNVREEAIPETEQGYAFVDQILCTSGPTKREYFALSVGSLGGGNHFIELDEDDEGRKYLVIHSGSRNLGQHVARHYQTLAERNMYSAGKGVVAELINRLKSEGREREIQQALKELPVQNGSRDPLAYVEDQAFRDYIHDMDISQQYAELNRQTIARVIVEKMGLTVQGMWQTIHNYIDIKNMILRKGAISAQAGERVIIPMNMRDGSLICIGKGNEDWNYSAPHGAGRLMSRSQAFHNISMEDFRKDMEGISSTSVCQSTLDEAPAAYKPMESILHQIGPTVEVEKIIRPIYNYKAH